MNIQNAILAFQKQTGVFGPGDRVVVGVSGGADSLALLHALAALRKTLRIELVAATLDHGLRGEESRADLEHVRRRAEAWNVSFRSGEAPVQALAEQWKMGIEEAARRARYDFLAAVAHDSGTPLVAVAHHAGDQAETVLMHLFRGSGLDGLAGMAAQSLLPNHDAMTLLRPLLGVTRAGILDYCAAHRIEFREDATNADTEANRNWVRHVLLPLIETRYPGAPRALADLARSVEGDLEALDAMTLYLTMSATRDAYQVVLSRPLFRQSSVGLQRRFVRWAVAALAPDAELSFERAEAVVDLFRNGRKGQTVQLTGGLSATVDRETVKIARISP